MDYADPKNFACTDLIDIKDYFAKYSKELEFVNKHENKQENLKCQPFAISILGVSVSMEQFENLEEKCSVDKLTIPDEIVQQTNKAMLSKNCNLLVKDMAINHLRIQKAKEKWNDYNNYCRNDIVSYTKERKENDAFFEDLTPNKDIVVIVRLYHPFEAHSANTISKVRFTHEIAILAQQSLTDLRDMFRCVADFGSCEEIEHPDDIIRGDMKEEYPSGFIFIENCFYNDMRHPKAIEYSKEVIEWAKKKRVAEYTTAKMEDTKIIDLKLRVGYPYLYQHQANCEHLVVFSDIRFLREDELRKSSEYPYVLAHEKFNRIACMMCKYSLADYIVSDCDRHLAKYNYLCKKCLLIYNYKDGEKVGEFRLFRYYNINFALSNE